MRKSKVTFSKEGDTVLHTIHYWIKYIPQDYIFHIFPIMS